MPRLNILYKQTALALCLAGNAVVLYAQNEKPEAYQVKAIYLFNFTQFVEWPPAAFQDDDAPLIIGVLGEDPLGTFLEEVIDGEQVHGRALSIRRYEPEEEVREGHVLFINLTDTDQIVRALERLKGRRILTVSDHDGFLEAGGMIQFISANNDLQFQINPEAASAADLKISSKLLRVAEVITLPNE